MVTALAQEKPTEVLAQLGGVCTTRGLDGLATRLVGLGELVRHDMESFEGAIAELERGRSIVHRSATHLLDLGGKRLRPMCVSLAARAGSGFGAAARELAVAVEVVHAATLLHDDVIDLGAERRGAPSARMIWGNAASIFAGDWLLIEAMKRVRRADVPGTLDRMLDVIDEMIRAESVQLENRGRVNTARADYFHVIEGKTAALFRWAMFAGGRAGGLDARQCDALEHFGLHLGVAFQLVDDLLDLTGDPRVTGKALFADLREGKMTYPLIVALERDAGLRRVLEEIVAAPGDKPPSEPLAQRVRDALATTRAVEDCRELAGRRAAEAVECLGPVPASAARAALVTVAEATLHREK